MVPADTLDLTHTPDDNPPGLEFRGSLSLSPELEARGSAQAGTDPQGVGSCDWRSSGEIAAADEPVRRTRLRSQASYRQSTSESAGEEPLTSWSAIHCG